MSHVKSHLQLIADLMEGKVPLAHEFVLKHGQRMYVKDNPYTRGTLGECYRNAMMLSQSTGLVYCEGWATSPGLSGVPLEHAWCMDPDDGLVIDPTWRNPEPEYFGVPLDPVCVAGVVIANQVYGVLPNLHRKREMKIEEIRVWLSSLLWVRHDVH